MPLFISGNKYRQQEAIRRYIFSSNTHTVKAALFSAAEGRAADAEIFTLRSFAKNI